MQKNRKALVALEDFGDTLLIAVVFWILIPQYPSKETVYIYLLLTAALSLVHRLLDLNAYISPIFSRSRYFVRLLLANLIFFSVTVAVFSVLTEDEYRRSVIFALVISASLITFILYAKKLLILRLLRIALSRKGRVYKMMIVGDNPDSARALVRGISHSYKSVMLIGAVGSELSECGCVFLGELESLSDIVERERPDVVVFAVKNYSARESAQLVSVCERICPVVYFLPLMYDFLKSPRQVEYLGTLPLVNVRCAAPSSPSGAFLKRALDIILSLLLIVLTLPLMLFCAVGVKVTSKGPVIFRQVRVGRYGKEFVMLKFRSMREGEPLGWDGSSDTRKTRFGNFLRRTSLDELPQFFNVLRGEMSLVGPRPEMPEFVEKFKHEIPMYMLKHYARPGITGLAQIKGFRGDTSLGERIRLDLYYIENWSLLLDIKIISMTPRALINHNEKYTETKK